MYVGAWCRNSFIAPRGFVCIWFPGCFCSLPLSLCSKGPLVAACSISPVFSLQAKEAGADDTLDISKCELSEVRSPQLLVLYSAEFSDCCLSRTVGFSVTAEPCYCSASSCLLSSGWQVRATSLFFFVADFVTQICVLPDASDLGVPFHLSGWEGQSGLTPSTSTLVGA